MRNTLILLSSLALAAAANAQTSATATSTTTVSYTAPNGGIRLEEVRSEAYNASFNGDPLDYSEDDGGRATVGSSSSTSHSSGGASFTMTATASASLDSPNYAAVQNESYVNRGQGYRYFLTLANTTNSPKTIAFAVSLSHSSSGSAASPYGLSDYNPDGSYNPGAYAQAEHGGGVLDISSENRVSGPLPNTRGRQLATAYDTSPGVAAPTFSSSDPYGYTATYTLGAGLTHIYEIYASAGAYADFVPAPVPEPASLAALGVGALALLRRRKR